jgi:acetyl esterase/lipase
MKKVITFIGVVMIVLGLTYHFAALATFNLLIPKDAGGKLLAQDVAYGEHARQKLDVYAPVDGQGPWPVVVFVHGGSWQTGNKNPYTFLGRAFAAQGFLTLVINYRLFPEDAYPAFVDDTALALRWARDNAKQFGGDGEKIFAIGHSAGGYNVAQAVLTGDVPKLRGVVAMAAPLDFLPLDSPVTIKVFENVPNLPDTQPVNHARADAPPFLILHGRDDKTVFLKNSQSLDRALNAAGAQSTLKVYDGVSHAGIMLALSKPLRSTPVLDDVVRFMRDKIQ